MNSAVTIPAWERYTLSIAEAAAYFRIGENKLRKMVNENKDADYLLWNGKHRLTRAHREKQLKMSCQALHNAPPNRT